MASRTGDKKVFNKSCTALHNCMSCKYFHLEVQQGGGWLEICEVTGGRTIWGDEGLNKSDNCPFMEVEDGTREEAKADSGRE